MRFRTVISTQINSYKWTDERSYGNIVIIIKIDKPTSNLNMLFSPRLLQFIFLNIYYRFNDTLNWKGGRLRQNTRRVNCFMKHKTNIINSCIDINLVILIC